MLKETENWTYFFDWLAGEAAKHAEWSRLLQRRIPHHTETITTEWIIKDLESVGVYSLREVNNHETNDQD